MRIWYQALSPLYNLTNHRDALAKHGGDVFHDGTEVHVNGASEVLYRDRVNAELFGYPFAKHVLQGEAIDFCRKAEAEGFDAYILGSFSEPFLREARSVVDIPVVSMAESSLLAACSMAEEFALVTVAPGHAKRLRATVRRHGLESRISGVYALNFDERQLNAAYKAPAEVIGSFTTVAERAVAEGGDLVIPAEGLLSQILCSHGVKLVAGAPVLDCVGVSMLSAAFMVNLKRQVGLSASRRSYRKPDPALLEELLRLRAHTID